MSVDSNKDTNTANKVADKEIDKEKDKEIEKKTTDAKIDNQDSGAGANVAEALNEIFDDDPAQKAREKEIAKYEKKRQKALEREARKAAKTEANSTSGWSWDKAVNENRSAQTAQAEKQEPTDDVVYTEDGELDEAALKKKLKAEKKAEKQLKKEQKKIQKKEEKEVNIVKDLLFLCLYILIVIGICWAVLTYVGQRTEVSGESMSNTLHSGDTLWIDKLEYEFGSPKRFDVVVFPYGDDEDTFYIKRIIGMPGETVYIDEEGTIYINDEPLEGDKYGREVIAEDKRGIASEEITLGEDEYFVLGDNRNNSRDSRVSDVGNIHKRDIIGRAVFRFTGGFGKIE